MFKYDKTHQKAIQSDLLVSAAALINLKVKKIPMVRPPLTSQVSREGVFEMLPPDVQFVRSEAR